MHEDRQAFATYLRHAGWSVVECQTEADIKVARDFMPGDIVLSRDSDMLMYESISTVWRPISAGRILVYDEPSALAALGINRTQLIVLGIVSKNVYNANIPSLGCATNLA